MRESAILVLAVGLFAIIKVLIPWQLDLLVLYDPEAWRPLAWQLGVTLAIAVTVWRWFENDGMVLVGVLLWLLSSPMYAAVTQFMISANE